MRATSAGSPSQHDSNHETPRPHEVRRSRLRNDRVAWIASLLFHGLLIALALLFVKSLHAPTPPDTFHWSVTLPNVQSEATQQTDVPTAAPQTATAPAPPPPAPSAPAQPARRASAPQPVATPSPTASAPRDNVAPAPPPVDVPPAPPAKTIEQPTVREMPTPPPPPEPQAEPEVRAQVTPPQPPQPPEPVPQPEPLTDIARVPDVPPTQSIDEPRPPVAPPAQTETVPASPATEPTATQQPSTANDTATPSPTAPQRTAKLDFGWLTERLTGQVAQAIRYPADARLNAWEGKVVVKVTVTAAGDLIDASVVRSSGHESLDQEALALLRRLSPLTLDRPLGKDRISLHLPIRFSLH